MTSYPKSGCIDRDSLSPGIDRRCPRERNYKNEFLHQCDLQKCQHYTGWPKFVVFFFHNSRFLWQGLNKFAPEYRV